MVQDASPVDPEAVWQTMKINLQHGIVTINEARDAQSVPPLAVSSSFYFLSGSRGLSRSLGRSRSLGWSRSRGAAMGLRKGMSK
jgi:hypothetical protein